MPRIFACLALCNLLLLGGTAAAGFLRVGGSPDRHILLAVTSLIATCFLQVLTFTYFTVSGKMIGQMVHLARLPTAYLDDVQRHKRSVTRHLAVCISGVVLSAGTGGALWRAGADSIWHLGSGATLLLAFLFAVCQEFNAIALNARLLNTVVRGYNAANLSHQAGGAPGEQSAQS